MDHIPTPAAAKGEFVLAHREPNSLSSRRRNARTHSKKQIAQIAESIRRFGFINPVLIDGSNTIIAGHGRVEAAKLLKLESVPTLRVDHLGAEEISAYVVADNKIAENAGWDHELLALEVKELSIDLELDMTVAGFDPPEIDLLICELDQAADKVDDVIPPPGPAVTRPGELWHLGAHRLLCGNALEAQDYARLMAGERAAMVFSDPPYNVPIAGHVSGLGAVQHREFAMASGEMSRAEFTQFLTQVCTRLAENTAPGSLHYLCMDWRHMGELLAAGEAIYGELKNLCVWAKTSAGMGSLYRSQHELVFLFRNGSVPHRNNVQLGKYGRNRTNVWNYPGVTGLTRDRGERVLELHPTVKPIALVADAILDCTSRGDLVLDAFLGSGTTILAAERTGRCGRGLELDPLYVDTAIRRWQKLTGDAARREDGRAFDDVAADRGAAAQVTPREGDKR